MCIRDSSWTLKDVSVFFFSVDNQFLRRIDAGSSVLKDSAWNFSYAVLNVPGQLPMAETNIKIETDLTVLDLESSFSELETISFWRLPKYIKTMEKTGFDVTPLKVYFHNLVSQPLLYIAMVLLAACVSLRTRRLQSVSVLILSGVAIGFLIFFMSNFLQALGVSGQIPIFIAAWFPAIISVLLGLGAIMVLEDG